MKAALKVEFLQAQISRFKEMIASYETQDQELVKKVAHLLDVIRQKEEILKLLDFAASIEYGKDI